MNEQAMNEREKKYILFFSFQRTHNITYLA
jgi:hypothetical protein